MSEASMSELERAETSFLASLVGESFTMEKLSSYDLARERVRLLGLLAQNGVGGGGGTLDQTAHDAAAAAQGEVDALEGVVAGLDIISPHTAVTVATPSLAAGAAHEVTANLGATYIIRNLGVDKAARVQGYTTTAARTADASRVFGAAFPAATAPYTVFDAKLPHEGALTLPVNLSGADALYLRITNTGTTAQVITLSLDRLELEKAV